MEKSLIVFMIQGFVLRNQIVYLGKVYFGNAEKYGNRKRIYKQCLSWCCHVRDQSSLLPCDNKYHKIRSFIIPVEGLRVFLFSPPPRSYGAIIVLVSFCALFCLFLANSLFITHTPQENCNQKTSRIVMPLSS